MKELWVEKYRPTSVDGYVFRDAGQRKQIEGWIGDGALPHLLFSGAPGTGKTTLAKVLLHSLDVDLTDILEINASNENGIDVIRDRTPNFVSTMLESSSMYCLTKQIILHQTGRRHCVV